MKSQFQILTVLVLSVMLNTASAQFGRGGAMAAPPGGPNLGGPNALLFGDNSSFTATMEMQAGSQPVSGKMSASDGKTRLEIDMTKAAGSRSASSAASMRSMGMDTVVNISRPDKNVAYVVYPGLNAYVETSVPETHPATAGKSKIETTKLGTETIDGHACIKNKVVVTDDKGATHEYTVWNAADLKNFPVKFEQIENAAPTTTISFKDVKLDKVDASLFDPPSAAKKYNDLTTLMQQEMMARALRGRGQ